MTRLLLLGAVEEQSVLEVDMLEAVVEEMTGDAAPAEASAKPRPDREGPAADAIARAKDEARQASNEFPAAPVAAPAEAGGAPDKGLLDHQIEAIEAAFAERDKHMSALRREVEKLSQERATDDLPADVDQRLASIEARLDEQERSLRHVLTMMIDYFESQGSRAAA
jgi:general secretion pathway protein A